jgi:hypothetical protein
MFYRKKIKILNNVIFSTILIICGLTFSCFAQNRIKFYKLRLVTHNADFNYKKLQNFDDISNAKSAFKPVTSGKFTVYKFIATFKGLGYWVPKGQTKLDSVDNHEHDKDGYLILSKEELKEMNKLLTFHDILIIKTNSKNEIVDAFQYTLEWADPSLTYDLFRSKTKYQKLNDGLSIQKLKFHRMSLGNEKELLNEKGFLKFKLSRPKKTIQDFKI